MRWMLLPALLAACSTSYDELRTECVRRCENRTLSPDPEVGCSTACNAADASLQAMSKECDWALCREPGDPDSEPDPPPDPCDDPETAPKFSCDFTDHDRCMIGLMRGYLHYQPGCAELLVELGECWEKTSCSRPFDFPCEGKSLAACQSPN